MANEALLTVSLQIAVSGQSLDTDNDFDLACQRLDVGSTLHVRGVLATTTSAAAIDLGSVTSCGLAVFRNRGATNIHIRAGSGGTNVITIPAGKGYACYLATNTPYAVAASSTSNLEYCIWQQ